MRDLSMVMLKSCRHYNETPIECTKILSTLTAWYSSLDLKKKKNRLEWRMLKSTKHLLKFLLLFMFCSFLLLLLLFSLLLLLFSESVRFLLLPSSSSFSSSIIFKHSNDSNNSLWFGSHVLNILRQASKKFASRT